MQLFEIWAERWPNWHGTKTAIAIFVRVSEVSGKRERGGWYYSVCITNKMCIMPWICTMMALSFVDNARSRSRKFFIVCLSNLPAGPKLPVCGVTISVCRQPFRSTQLGRPFVEKCNEYLRKPGRKQAHRAYSMLCMLCPHLWSRSVNWCLAEETEISACLSWVLWFCRDFAFVVTHVHCNCTEVDRLSAAVEHERLRWSRYDLAVSRQDVDSRRLSL